MFITFDPYYDINQYNHFIKVAKSKGLEIKEYISLKAPHHWYIKVNQAHFPAFLDFKLASDAMSKYLVEKLTPLYPNEAMLLTRRPTDSLVNFEKFVSPKVFQRVKNASYVCLFRYKNRQELLNITKELPTKIYDLGYHKTWNLAICFNKYIRNHVFSSHILIEKTNETQFGTPGEFELHLNYKILVNTKFNNKTIEYPYAENGNYFTLKRPTPK